jgi:anti-sigma-K factor RskA
MNCNELRDHYELFAIGIAEDPERSEIRAHLNRKCDVCTAGVRKALEMAGMIGATAPQSQPSAKLRRRILASAGVEQRGFRWAPVWAIATALSVAVAAYFAVRAEDNASAAERLQAQVRAQSDQITELTQAFVILNGPETKEAVFGGAQPTPPRGKVFLNPSQGVLLMASNLPPAPSGKLYEMWVIPKGGRPVAAGMFQSKSDGSAMHVRQGPVDAASTNAVAVTVENEAGADQPTSQPLIVAPFTGGQ